MENIQNPLKTSRISNDNVQRILPSQPQDHMKTRSMRRLNKSSDKGIEKHALIQTAINVP